MLATPGADGGGAARGGCWAPRRAPPAMIPQSPLTTCAGREAAGPSMFFFPSQTSMERCEHHVERGPPRARRAPRDWGGGPIRDGPDWPKGSSSKSDYVVCKVKPPPHPSYDNAYKSRPHITIYLLPRFMDVLYILNLSKPNFYSACVGSQIGHLYIELTHALWKVTRMAKIRYSK